MQHLSILEHYAREALKQAQYTELEDGLVEATVPVLPGVLAFGETHDEAVMDLYSVVEDWARLGVEVRGTLPVVGGIDLNTEEARRLARC